jgi:hypothetical protein
LVIGHSSTALDTILHPFLPTKFIAPVPIERTVNRDSPAAIDHHTQCRRDDEPADAIARLYRQNYAYSSFLRLCLGTVSLRLCLVYPDRD